METTGVSHARNDQRFRTLLESAPDAIIVVNREGKILIANRAVELMFGYTRAEILGCPVESLIPEQFRVAHQQRREGFIRAPHTRAMGSGLEIRGRRKDGSEFPADVALGISEGEGGMEVMAIVRDISERKRMEETIKDAERRYQSLYESNPTIYFTYGSDGAVRSINPFGASELGYVDTDLIGRNATQVLFQEADRDLVLEHLRACLTLPNKVNSWEARMLKKDGTSIWVRAMARGANDDQGCPIVYVVCQDVTSEREISSQITYKATHDSLTGLVNRAEFEHRLARVIDTARTTDTDHALCYLDLDQFKVVNDACGHLAGDELLRQIAGVLREHTRKRDTVGRLGGDEFAVLLEHCSLRTAMRVAEKMRRAIVKHRFVWDDKVFGVGASIGLVPITAATESVTEAIRASDSACYMAKQQGRNRINVFKSGDMAESSRQVDGGWVDRIRNALANNGMMLFMQRVTTLKDARSDCVDCEVLLRMSDGHGGIILPSAFLPAAERHDLSAQIDIWVIKELFEWFANHQRCVEVLRCCSVNVSGQAIRSQEYRDAVIGNLKRGLFPAQKLCFEITEATAVANFSHVIEFVKAISGYGCKFALDDFGSGVSSFAHLRSLPVDLVKFDGAFVRDIATDSIDCAVLRSINQLTQLVGRKTIAKSVETTTVLAKLREIGVDCAQGNVLGQPAVLNEAGFALEPTPV